MAQITTNKQYDWTPSGRTQGASALEKCLRYVSLERTSLLVGVHRAKSSSRAIRNLLLHDVQRESSE